MQTKNKMKKFAIIFLSFFILNSALIAEEFDITANEVLIDKENEIIIGIGSVNAIDSQGKIISGDKITYKKSNEFLLVEGNAVVEDTKGNILKSEKITYDKIKEIIKTFDNTEILTKEGYKLNSKNVTYNRLEQTLGSSENSILTDRDGNIIETSMFNYDIYNDIFSAVGSIKVLDISKNKYFFKEIHVNTKNKEIIGSDVSVLLNPKAFGVSEENDPRFVSNDVFVNKNKIDLEKGVFTICKKRDDKCPPWSLKAKKISHDKIKKTIYYEHATLKLYDVPIFYFPRFFHPDPTVERQSGFLAPFFTNTTAVGNGFALPYYWAIGKDKDLTFTPKIYGKENPLFLNEYRQAFQNAYLILDTSYTEGYKNTSLTKSEGSQTHFFGNLDINLGSDKPYESNLNFKVQKTSNPTFFRKHDINTALVQAENTNLNNEIKYNLVKDDMFFSIATNVYEDLRVKGSSDKYEYILPNIIYGKTFFTDKLGTINFKSDALYTNYKTNKHRTILTNDVIWSPPSNITKNGFINTLQGMVRNTNYEAKNSEDYKSTGTVNEIHGVISNKISLPLKKDGINYSNLFSPNFMVRYAPGHMKDLSKKDVTLNYSNLYSLNKTPEIEDGLSAILGFDFTVNKKGDNEVENEKLSLSLGQVFNFEDNEDMPSKSSMDNKVSDVVGKINYNFSEIGEISYNFALDQNLSDLNYNEVSTELNFGKVGFNLDYLEQQNHIGTEHYVSSGVTLNFNKNNKLNFSTKKNFKTESTELYNLSYQYAIDCLTAGLVYRREFYQDSDLEPNNTLMFTITFVPFTNISTPAINP